ncbi:MAG: LytTR family DNA-binding domain-containing protein [Lachnospiraceae bacterium]|nr:LytTR family DNA-binding domain-containing protein [Lachnospiraceae bacterium]
MFRITICDDSKKFSERLAEQINRVMGELGEEYELTCCADIFALDTHLRSSADDLLFLDIRLGTDNGLNYARKLRARGNDIPIVFVTSNTEYALDAYDVYPLTFLAKPFRREAVQKAIVRCLALKEKDEGKVITLKERDRGMMSVRLNEICYAESCRHGVRLCCGAKGDYYFRENLREFLTLLPQDSFVQCQRSYIANLRRVRNIKNRTLLFDNGEEVSVSRALYSEIKERFAQL